MKKDEYLIELYRNILYRDIITRYKLPSEKPIKETVYYAASNIAINPLKDNENKPTNITIPNVKKAIPLPIALV